MNFIYLINQKNELLIILIFLNYDIVNLYYKIVIPFYVY